MCIVAVKGNLYPIKKERVFARKTDYIQIVSMMFKKYTGFLSKQVNFGMKKKLTKSVYHPITINTG